MTVKTIEQFAAAHDALPDEAHVCPEYNLTPEWCYRATACTECGTRRDEHADQPEQSAFPELDITDHIFAEPLKRRVEAERDAYQLLVTQVAEGLGLVEQALVDVCRRVIEDNIDQRMALLKLRSLRERLTTPPLKRAAHSQ